MGGRAISPSRLCQGCVAVVPGSTDAGIRPGSATATDPVGPIGDLGFPDRHDPLDLVHDPCTGREGFRAMDRGACDRDGIPADRDAAESVDDGQVRETELVLGPCCELGEALDRHRTVHLVIEGSHPFVRADRPDEQDDRTRVLSPHAVDHGLEIDARPPNLDHPAPPLTGGRSATSSPSCRIRSDAARSLFTARSIVSRWPASRGYFATTPSTSSRRLRPSREDQVKPRDPTISRYVANSRTWIRMDALPWPRRRKAFAVTAGGRGPGSPLDGGGAPRRAGPDTHREPPRVSAVRPRTGGRRGSGMPGPCGRRAPRSARSTGIAVRESPST